MKTTTYNKLVRYKIPKIIEQSGKTAVAKTLPGEKYYNAQPETARRSQ